MDAKTPAKISVVSAAVILLTGGILTMFIQLVLLNGVMNEGQAATALGITLGCQGLTILLGAISARWLTRLLILRRAWNRTLAVIVPVILVIILGTAAGFLSILGGLMAAGIH